MKHDISRALDLISTFFYTAHKFVSLFRLKNRRWKISKCRNCKLRLRQLKIPPNSNVIEKNGCSESETENQIVQTSLKDCLFFLLSNAMYFIFARIISNTPARCICPFLFYDLIENIHFYQFYAQGKYFWVIDSFLYNKMVSGRYW